jgi:hypothetical protein
MTNGEWRMVNERKTWDKQHAHHRPPTPDYSPLSTSTAHCPPITIYDLLFAWDSGTNDACFAISNADTSIYKLISCPTCMGQSGTNDWGFQILDFGSNSKSETRNQKLDARPEAGTDI